ncbi:restriction endonuclease [Bradyrhizobium cenepequi]
MGFPITCEACREDVTGDMDLAGSQFCPRCGSAAIKIHMEASSLAVASSGIGVPSLHELTAVASLVMQTIIVPGNRTTDGQLIEAATLPWFEIVRILNEDPSAAFQIPPRKLEEVIAAAYKQSGFDEVTLTPRSNDFGRDIIAVKWGLGSVRVIDQVKAYKPDHLVTADEVRALIGVLLTDPTSAKGFVTTTSSFAPRIRSDPGISSLIPARLELIDGKTLLKRLQEVAFPKAKSD